MTLYHHLDHALAVMRKEKDWRKWAPLIEAIPEPAREPCRLWLREEARRRQLHARNNEARNRGGASQEQLSSRQERYAGGRKLSHG